MSIYDFIFLFTFFSFIVIIIITFGYLMAGMNLVDMWVFVCPLYMYTYF